MYFDHFPPLSLLAFSASLLLLSPSLLSFIFVFIFHCLLASVWVSECKCVYVRTDACVHTQVHVKVRGQAWVLVVGCHFLSCLRQGLSVIQSHVCQAGCLRRTSGHLPFSLPISRRSMRITDVWRRTMNLHTHIACARPTESPPTLIFLTKSDISACRLSTQI